MRSKSSLSSELLSYALIRLSIFFRASHVLITGKVTCKRRSLKTALNHQSHSAATQSPEFFLKQRRVVASQRFAKRFIIFDASINLALVIVVVRHRRVNRRQWQIIFARDFNQRLVQPKVHQHNILDGNPRASDSRLAAACTGSDFYVFV